jgi:hypothetical protein
MPFRGETGGVAPDRGMGEVPHPMSPIRRRRTWPRPRGERSRSIPTSQRRLDDARRAATEHGDHDSTRHAPRNTRLER